MNRPPKGTTYENPKRTASIDPEALDAFYRAMTKAKIDLVLYDLTFNESPESFLIVATHRFSPPGIRGSDLLYPNYEVSVSRTDYSVEYLEIAK